MAVTKNLIEDKADLPCGNWQKRGYFHQFYLKHSIPISNYKKCRKHWKILKPI
jgi:hypothetical protein